MKYCPNCQTRYSDDTLKFCLEDGTRLEGGLFEPPPAAFGETETIASPRVSEKIRVDVPNTSGENFSPNQASQVTNILSAPPETRKSNTVLTILLTAGGMLLLFGAVGSATWFYLKKEQVGIAGNMSNPPDMANQGIENDLNKNSGLKKSPTPKLPANSANPANSNISSNSNLPKIDREQIKSDVSQVIADWKSKSESLDLDEYMDNYADTVDYYKKSGASRAFVRSDKERAFTKFDSIRVNLTNISISPDESGARATALLDKEWQFSGAEGSSSGKVRQQLSLKKIGGKWLITGEKDLKIYYGN